MQNLKVSSANSFSLEESKNLLFKKGIIYVDGLIIVRKLYILWCWMSLYIDGVYTKNVIYFYRILYVKIWLHKSSTGV